MNKKVEKTVEWFKVTILGMCIGLITYIVLMALLKWIVWCVTRYLIYTAIATAIVLSVPVYFRISKHFKKMEEKKRIVYTEFVN